MAGVSNAVKAKIIGEYIVTPQGRQRLAASMTQPLRMRRDYAAIGRKTFKIEQLPDGALAIYDKDPEVVAYVIGEEGQNIVAVAKSRRVHFPTFEIAANPEIPLSQLRQRRFDSIQRMQDLGASQIQACEDERVFAVLDSIAVNGFDSVPGQVNADIPVVAPITSAVMADAFSLIEDHDLRVARVYMSARDYADIRKWGRDVLDIESQAHLLKTGLQATLWGAKIVTSRLVPRGVVYLTAEPEMFGRFPVRTELTVLSADDPKARTIGFSMFEEIGIGAYNPYGLARVLVTR